jgi:hypothetical protein
MKPNKMLARGLPLFFSLILNPAFSAGTDSAAPTSGLQKNTPFDGRVFFSAAERRALEVKPPAPVELPAEPPEPPPPPRRFNGGLWREGRILALWFDGGVVDPASEPSIRLIRGIPGTSGASLQPGQFWPPRNGTAP